MYLCSSCGAVDFVNRRYVSTNLDGIASQATVFLNFVVNLICKGTVVSLERYGLKDNRGVRRFYDGIRFVFMEMVQIYYLLK
jgi:hypothetical protein